MQGDYNGLANDVCGLAGFVAPSGQPAADLRACVHRMAATLAHRGPDDAGEWADANSGVALGFRRLSIIDVSPAGHQPMVSASGRYVAILNGEIYNFREFTHELAREGSPPAYRGRSDTEAMLAAIDAWGVAGAVGRFNGMFAIAVWDTVERTLTLVRDRLGVKPLYYGWAGRTFVFGSELKALAVHPDFQASLDRAAVELLLRFTYIPAPRTIYAGVAKLTPGSILTFTPRTGRTETVTYWSAASAAARGVANRFAGTEADAAEAVESLLADAVRLRMIADVPLGVFLSGGIDSSLVTALMQAQSSAPVRTFSIGLEDSDYNEAPFARAVATHLGTDHTDLYVSPAEALDVIPKLAAMYDEPFADSSAIPTHLVARLARQSVTVSLSGDGGDELFGGYVRYQLGRQFDRLTPVPGPLRRAASRAMTSFSAERWDRWLAHGSRVLPQALRAPGAGARLHKAARVLGASEPDAMYFELVSHWMDVMPGGGAARAPIDDPGTAAGIEDPVERMMLFDQVSYLPDDLLVKVDRASMAVGLEAREPLLDYRLVEFAWTLPSSMKVRRRETKPILRRVLDRHVPPHLLDRPKMGFAVPIGRWLRGPLRDWAESLLDARRLKEHEWLHAAPIRAAWAEHLAGQRDWQFHLWAVLMLQAWMSAQGEPASAKATA